MKKRNLAITAFVLCATLIMAIGFASLTGSLRIDGTATFNGSTISEEILNSVKFTNARGNDSYTSATFEALTAQMKVNFYDLASDDTIVANQVLSASATFFVSYVDSGNVASSDLPAVEFDIPTPTINNSDFSISVDWSEKKTLNVGDTIEITVTVTYRVPNEVPTDTVSGTISIPLNYNVKS